MENRNVTFRISKEFHSHLVMESHRISLLKGKSFNLSDLIREAIEVKYPIITSKTKNGGKDDGEKGQERKRGRKEGDNLLCDEQN